MTTCLNFLLNFSRDSVLLLFNLANLFFLGFYMKLKIALFIFEKNCIEIVVRITLVLLIASGSGVIFNHDHPTDP